MFYDIAVIIAAYNSSRSIEMLVDQLDIYLNSLKLNYRIIIVNDFSTDDTDEVIDKISKDNQNVTSIHLKYNCGQQNALLCGLDHAKNCRFLITMDDDMQQPPEITGDLYRKIQNGYDIVYAIPTQTHTKIYRRIGSIMRDFFFSLFITKTKNVKVSSFCIMSADLAEKIRGIRGKFVYLSASAFRSPICAANIYYKRNKRIYGKSGYTIKKLSRLYINLLIYYTKLGSIFKSKVQMPPYEIERINIGIQKRLMILGGSNCQMSAVLAAHNKGFFTVLADYLNHPPASAYADSHVKVSTFDKAGCKDAATFYKVDGIMTAGSDQPVYTAAYVAAELKLPSAVTVQTAYHVTNKKPMKQIMTANKIPTVNYRFIDTHSQPETIKILKSPLVIKPLDSQGQRGIYKLDTVQEVFGHLQQTLSFSSESEALVEEYYPSDEITVSCWVSNGQVSILSITDRLHYPDKKHIGICIEHRFPSKHMQLYDEISVVSKKLVLAFDITQGPLYIQMFVGDEGIKVNELACRIGGAFEDVFIPYLTGFDILDSVINLSMGQDIDISALKDLDISKSDKQVSVQLMFCRSGLIESITPVENILKLPFVISAAYNYKAGDYVPGVENATARFGHCVIVSDKKPVDLLVKQLYENLMVRSADGDNMLLQFRSLYGEKYEKKDH